MNAQQAREIADQVHKVAIKAEQERLNVVAEENKKIVEKHLPSTLDEINEQIRLAAENGNLETVYKIKHQRCLQEFKEAIAADLKTRNFAVNLGVRRHEANEITIRW